MTDQGLADAVAQAVNSYRQQKYGVSFLSLPVDGAVPELGHAVKHLFTISPLNRSINFSSYGLPPLSIVAKRMGHVIETMDSNVDLFMRVTAEPMLREVRSRVAAFIGHPQSEDLFLVDNAGEAFNTLCRGVITNPLFHKWLRDLASRGELAVPDLGRSLNFFIFANQYPMCHAALNFYNSRSDEAEQLTNASSDAPTCHVTPVVFTVTPELLANEAALIESVVSTAKASNSHFFLVDHVCWSPAFVFPILEICRKLRREVGQIVIMIDGAHAIGQIDLKPFFEENATYRASHSGIPLFDAYFSNFHKWLLAPRHCCMLYCDPRLQRFLHPNIVDNFYRGHCQSDTQGSLQHEFFWCGTKDFSNFLVIPDLISFRSVVLGGEQRIMDYNHNLIITGARLVASIWGTEVLVDDPSRIGSMTCVRVPCEEPKVSEGLLMELLRTSDTFAPPLVFAGRPYVRLSAQVYNALSDYEHFAKAFLKMLSTKSTSI